MLIKFTHKPKLGSVPCSAPERFTFTKKGCRITPEIAIGMVIDEVIQRSKERYELSHVAKKGLPPGSSSAVSVAPFNQEALRLYQSEFRDLVAKNIAHSLILAIDQKAKDVSTTARPGKIRSYGLPVQQGFMGFHGRGDSKDLSLRMTAQYSPKEDRIILCSEIAFTVS